MIADPAALQLLHLPLLQVAVDFGLHRGRMTVDNAHHIDPLMLRCLPGDIVEGQVGGAADLDRQT
ncbi:hypothetical protein D3C71_2141010 [compost metagenome]